MDPDRFINNLLGDMGVRQLGMMPRFGMESMFGPPNPGSSMLPFGFMSPMSMMMDPFQHMQQVMSMPQNGVNGTGGFSYCSSSVTSYTTDEHGRPQVYQQSNEIKQGPNGVKETKSALRDTRTGRQELAIGHHLYDKSLVKKKSKNTYTGEEEQEEELTNLEEQEAEAFESNWMQQARNCTTNLSNNQLQYIQTNSRPRNSRLALTAGPSDEHPKVKSHTSLIDKIAMKAKKKKKNKGKDTEQ